nr:unnamed protein product [Callosobruchus chinensis]
MFLENHPACPVVTKCKEKYSRKQALLTGILLGSEERSSQVRFIDRRTVEGETDQPPDTLAELNQQGYQVASPTGSSTATGVGMVSQKLRMTQSQILGMLRTVREPIADYQENRGVSRTEQISFVTLVTSLCTHAYTAAITILVMLWNLAPLLDGFVYFARFLLDRLIDIVETEDPKDKIVKSVVFLVEIIIVLFIIFLIMGLIFMPVYVLSARIVSKVWVTSYKKTDLVRLVTDGELLGPEDAGEEAMDTRTGEWRTGDLRTPGEATAEAVAEAGEERRACEEGEPRMVDIGELTRLGRQCCNVKNDVKLIELVPPKAKIRLRDVQVFKSLNL